LRQQLRIDAVDLVQQLFEHVLFDLRILPQRSQHLLLPFELLQQVGLQVGARRDVGDLEQRDQRRVMILRRVLRGEIAGAREEILEPHQGAYSFVQRMFVADHLGAGSTARQRAILRRTGTRFKFRADRRALAVQRIETRDLAGERRYGTAVVDHVVGARQAL